VHGTGKNCRDLERKQRKDYGDLRSNDGLDIYGDIHCNGISDSTDLDHIGITCHIDECRLAYVCQVNMKISHNYALHC
tara:strand:- start:51 stop:284 length:234 start_codon:yes stop_codon:yes gene_type:complete